MEAITQKHVSIELKKLNQIMNTPEETYRNGKFIVGNIHSREMAIVQTLNEIGGVAVLARGKTRKEVWAQVKAMHQAVWLFRARECF